MCQNGSDYGACINEELICDNVIDCYDAEDEQDCAGELQTNRQNY